MLKEYKHALLFLTKYVLVYLVLNTLYAFYVEYYSPNPDPVTILVTKHAAFVISRVDHEVSYRVVGEKANVPITKNLETIIEVFEGCNSINVVVVFVSFIIAFKGHWKDTVQFIFLGAAVIYSVNLLRIIGLYWVALQFPNALYFFHKFLFTGFIYLFVFALWYWWTIKVKQWKANPS